MQLGKEQSSGYPAERCISYQRQPKKLTASRAGVDPRPGENDRTMKFWVSLIPNSCVITLTCHFSFSDRCKWWRWHGSERTGSSSLWRPLFWSCSLALGRTQYLGHGWHFFLLALQSAARKKAAFILSFPGEQHKITLNKTINRS